MGLFRRLRELPTCDNLIISFTAEEFSCEYLASYHELDKFLTKPMAVCLGYELEIKDVSLLYEHNFDRLSQFFTALWFYDSSTSMRLLKFF